MPHKSKTNKVLRSMQMLDDSTVEVVFKDAVCIDVDDIKQTYDEMLAFTNHQKMKKLIITGKRTEITKEARLFGHELSLKMKDLVIAEAIVVHSLYQKMVINLYSQFVKERYPTKYFTDFDKAKDWLQSYS